MERKGQRSTMSSSAQDQHRLSLSLKGARSLDTEPKGPDAHQAGITEQRLTGILPPESQKQRHSDGPRPRIELFRQIGLTNLGFGSCGL